MKLQSASAWRASLLLLTLAGTQSAIADNTRGQARDIGTDPASYVRNDMVGATDSMDYWQVHSALETLRDGDPHRVIR